MSDLKERRRRADEDQEEMEEEVDADVPDTAELLHKGHEIRRSALERAVKFVFDRAWSMVFFASASFGCYELQMPHELLYSRYVHRGSAHLFVLFVSLAVLIGSYMEIYRSLWCKEKLKYENAKTSTRSLLLSMALAGICFMRAVWPLWHWLTLPYTFMAFFGVFLQALVIFPPKIQPVLIGIAYVAFMYEYGLTLVA